MCLQRSAMILFFSFFLIPFFMSNAFGDQVEIEFDGLSPAAQTALDNMSKFREEVKGTLAEPLGRLKTLRETYVHSCGGGKPKDSGCQDQFNQIIDAHKEVMEKIAGFLNNYNNNLEVVIDELEPQIEQIAYENSPSDLNEDLIRKFEEVDEEFQDEFAQVISEAFGLGEGQTEYELASTSYMQYKSEYNQYKRLSKMLNGKIRTAQRQRDLGPILNPETTQELKKINDWIFGKKVKPWTSTPTAKRTTVLR